MSDVPSLSALTSRLSGIRFSTSMILSIADDDGAASMEPNEDGTFAEDGGATKPTKQDADQTTHQVVTDTGRLEKWLKVPVPDPFADWTEFDLAELWG